MTCLTRDDDSLLSSIVNNYASIDYQSNDLPIQKSLKQSFKRVYVGMKELDGGCRAVLNNAYMQPD